MWKIAIFAIISAISSKAYSNDYCYATDPIQPQKSHFCERTSYDAVKGTFNPNASSCTPTKFWFYTRHAARLPNALEIEKFQNIQPVVNNIIDARNAGRGSLCQQDFDLIANWQLDPNITVEVEQHLTESGWNEMFKISRRYQKAYLSLLNTSYSRNQFTFRNTNRQRSIATAHAFAEGLFGPNANSFVNFELSKDTNKLFRPHVGCLIFEKAVHNSTEHSVWKNGARYRKMIDNVNEKLGLNGNQKLTEGQVRTLWHICNYEQLWNMFRPAPFCGAFSYDDNLILEYFEDLESYYSVGYGGPRKLLENMNCALMQDLMSFMKEDVSEERVRIYGSHKTDFIMFLESLGVFKDENPLTASNFAQQTNRKWKLSLISSMASHIAVVRYNCPEEDDELLFLINEKPLVIPGCRSNGICKLSFIQERYKKFINANCETLSCSYN